MKVVTAEEIREIDRRAMEDYGIPSEVLMGFAGRAVVTEMLKEFPSMRSVAVFAGAGNNGGDGFVIAYLLGNAGIDVTVYFCGSPDRMSGATDIYYSLCLKAGIRVIAADETAIDCIDLSSHDCIVDALLGTRLQRSSEGVARGYNKTDKQYFSSCGGGGYPQRPSF